MPAQSSQPVVKVFPYVEPPRRAVTARPAGGSGYIVSSPAWHGYFVIISGGGTQRRPPASSDQR